MSLTVEFTGELEKNLLTRAARENLEASRFVVQAVQEKLAKKRTFRDICRPFADAVAASGMTDEELDQLVEEAREEIWQEKHGPR